MWSADGGPASLTRMGDPCDFYESPSSTPIPVSVQPRVASWNAATHPNQTALTRWLEHAHALIDDEFPSVPGPLAVRLDIGLADSTALSDGYDLDNYAYPLISRLSRSTAERIATVWCGKSLATDSSMRVGSARSVGQPRFDRNVTVRTTASATTTAYKRQIHDRAKHVPMLQPGPVTMQIAFAVSPRRNWINLWKATIDSLDPLLGRTNAARDWHPLDGRIIELGLHRRVDAALGNDVVITIGASNTNPRADEPPRLEPIPPRTAAEYDIIEFALTYNVYEIRDLAAAGAMAQAIESAWINTGRLCEHVDCLRTTLFHLQRAHRHSDDPTPLRENPLVVAILDQLHRTQPSGVPVIGAF